MTVSFGNVVEIGYAIDVDYVFGRNESQLHHGNETLAAGEQLCFRAELLQQGDSFVEGARRVVLKAPRYHRALPFLHRNQFVQLSVSTGKAQMIPQILAADLRR